MASSVVTGLYCLQIPAAGGAILSEDRAFLHSDSEQPMINAAPTIGNAFAIAEGTYSQVGMGLKFESLPGENPDAFRASVERRARDFRQVSNGEDPSTDEVLTLFFAEGDTTMGIVFIRAEPQPAPLPAPLREKGSRGTRGGKQKTKKKAEAAVPLVA